MPIAINTDKLYDTDLTDAAWALIAPMLPAARRGGRPRTTASSTASRSDRLSVGRHHG
jgi:transposase